MSRILLAPMEGLADDLLRGVLVAIGGYDRGICEFVRVSDNVLPAKIDDHICPELMNGSEKAADTTMRVQFLTAENARRLVSLNPAGIDLNFGYPAIS